MAHGRDRTFAGGVGTLGIFDSRQVFPWANRGSNPARCVQMAKAQWSRRGVDEATPAIFLYNKQIFTSNLVVKMTWIKQKKKQSQRTVSPDARVRDPMMEVARNGGFRRRINTDPFKSCFMRMSVECARVHVACVVHAKSGVARRPRWPRWLSIALPWPISHRVFNFSIYYGL